MSRDQIFDVIEMDAAEFLELPEADPVPAAAEYEQEGESTEELTEEAAQTT